jgi:uncharacterized membrane protein YfhO
VRHNWFPRWEATVNGARAAVTQTADGYMTVEAPEGLIRLDLRYRVDWVDWMARGASAAGLGALLWMLVPVRPNRGWGRR